MTRVLALVAGAVLASAIVACAGVRKTSQATPGATEATAAPDAGLGLQADPRSKIRALDADIADNLDRLGVRQPEAWGAAGSMSVDSRPMTEIRAVCTPPARPSETCGDVCNLSDHICDNAGQICELADELQPDSWSKGKCENGKQSCEAARKRCCECS
jgi:hypothetical protein